MNCLWLSVGGEFVQNVLNFVRNCMYDTKLFSVLLADGMGTCEACSLPIEYMQMCIYFISSFTVCLKLRGTYPGILYTFRMMETVHFVINHFRRKSYLHWFTVKKKIY